MTPPNSIDAPPLFAKYRTWIMVTSILLFLPPLSFLFQFTGDSNFCGAWCPRMFFVWRDGMTAQAYLIGFLRSYMGVALVFGTVLTTLFLGRHWCSHLCPVGGVMELSSRLVPRRFKLDFSGIPAPAFRYGYLGVYFGAAALGIGSLCCSYCNFATIPRIFGAAFSGADQAYFLRTAGLINLGLVLALGAFARGGRAYCNLICPVGAVDALANRLGMRFGNRVAIAVDRCDGCGLCRDACPTWAIAVTDTARIDPYACMPCRRCEVACPKAAIGYGNTGAETERAVGEAAYGER
jgi:ferredoxin-type protein NapH